MPRSPGRCTLRPMTSFFVETFIPSGDRDRFSADVSGLRSAAATIRDPAEAVAHVRSYLVPSDDLGVHVVEADSAEAVVRLAKLAGVEFERIVTAISDARADPAGGRPSGSGSNAGAGPSTAEETA